MPIETLNLALFNLLNASVHAKPFIIDLAIFVANDLLYILLGLLIFLWCSGDLELKERAFKAVTLTAIALLVSYLISLVYFHPRPFVMGVGQTLIEHRPSASFPSNHMLIFSTIALSYYGSGRKLVGGILLLLAFAVAWSRVYLGVHFPLDMLGALVLASLVNIVGFYVWQRYHQIFMRFALTVYQCLGKPLLNRGWIK